MSISISVASQDDAGELADVAAATFPLACPPTSAPEDVAAFITTRLSQQRFGEYLDDPNRTVFIARDEARILGYAIVIQGVSVDPDVLASVTTRPASELSKLYVLPDRHGAGIAQALMDASIKAAGDSGARCLWLGVNQKNLRAQRFYSKNGFTVAGTRTFTVGAHIESDFVMVRPYNA